MRTDTGAVLRNLAASSLLAVCALLPGVQSAPAIAAASAWTPQPYVPKTRRDLTGVWVNKGGIGWQQGIPPGRGQNPPLTPEYRRIWDQHLANAAAGHPTGDPTAACLPQGMPRIMTMTFPMEIIMNERQVNILAEWNSQVRRIFIDGRPLPAPRDIETSYNGTSVGRWEGDVLIVDTVGLRGDTNLEASGLPHSDALTVRERIWLSDDNTLKDEITLIDPKAYTQPWTVTKTYHRAAPGDEIMEYVCLENQRNPVDDQGRIGVILAPQAP